MLDPVPLSVFLALVVAVAGLVTLLTRGPVPAIHRADDGLLIALTIATALSLGLLWLSPLLSLVLTVGFLVAQSLFGFEFT